MKHFLVVDVGDPSVGLQSSLAVDLAVSDGRAENKGRIQERLD